ncbi:MAG: alpha/beta hydrolase, partial [Bacteroidota bacterium]
MKTSIQKIVPRAIGGTLHAVNTIAPELVGRTCIRLFCTPREGRLDADDEAFLSGAAQRGQLLHPTGPIPYYVWNPAATQSILLLHGWESNAARWQRLLPYLLEADLRVIAIDAPAHGASEQRLFDMKRYADFLHSTMLHFKPDFLLGHSVGGATAVYYSTHYPTP